MAESGSVITVSGTLSTTTNLNSGSNFAVATDKFTANATTGNVAFLGDLAINTDKFTVNATSGNTLVAGTLSSGAISSTGDVTLANGNALRWTSDDVRIEGTTSGDNLKFYVGNSQILELTQSGTLATFAGDVYTTGTSNSFSVISRDNMFVDSGQFYIGADDAVTDDSFRQRTSSGSYFIESRKSGTWTNRLQINSAGTLIASQGATFAGSITGTTASFSGSINASGNSNTFGNTTIGALSASSGTFSASVTAAGNSNSFGSSTFAGDIMPAAENLYDIGSAATRWEDIYADQIYGRSVYVDTKIIHAGNDDNFIEFGTDTISISKEATFSGDVTVGNEVYLDNGKYLRFKRSSGGLSIQTLGIEAGTDDVRLLTSGAFNVVNGGLTNLLHISNLGNVGIATDSPDHKLRVDGDARLGNLHIKTSDFGVGGTGKTIYADGAGGGLLGFISTTAFDFSNGSTSRMHIDSSGNVGIATTSPDAKLEITTIRETGIRLSSSDLSAGAR